MIFGQARGGDLTWFFIAKRIQKASHGQQRDLRAAGWIKDGARVLLDVFSKAYGNALNYYFL